VILCFINCFGHVASTGKITVTIINRLESGGGRAYLKAISQNLSGDTESRYPVSGPPEQVGQGPVVGPYEQGNEFCVP
jgi:hypothetical protein